MVATFDSHGVDWRGVTARGFSRGVVEFIGVGWISWVSRCFDKLLKALFNTSFLLGQHSRNVNKRDRRRRGSRQLLGIISSLLGNRRRRWSSSWGYQDCGQYKSLMDASLNRWIRRLVAGVANEP
jgi:hypothetical protein